MMVKEKFKPYIYARPRYVERSVNSIKYKMTQHTVICMVKGFRTDMKTSLVYLINATKLSLSKH